MPRYRLGRTIRLTLVAKAVFVYALLLLVGTAVVYSVDETAIRVKVKAWLNCEECNRGEFQQVVSLGHKANPLLRDTLLSKLSHQELEDINAQLDERYSRLKEYQELHPNVSLPYSKEEYKREAIANIMAGRQIRAAKALARIGNADAIVALEEAMKRPLRGDVRRIIAQELVKLK